LLRVYNVSDRWSTVGVILTGENRSTWRGTSPIVTLFLVRKNNSLKIFHSANFKKYIFNNVHILYTIIIKMS
jgi:hypothetical protein